MPKYLKFENVARRQLLSHCTVIRWPSPPGTSEARQRRLAGGHYIGEQTVRLIIFLLLTTIPQSNYNDTMKNCRQGHVFSPFDGQMIICRGSAQVVLGERLPTVALQLYSS